MEREADSRAFESPRRKQDPRGRQEESEEVVDDDERLDKFLREMRLTGARRGYLLKLQPAFAHHRVGAAERAVHLLKCFFRDVSRDKVLTAWKLRYLVKKFSYIHNSRPVAISGRGDCYLTRAHTLAGRNIPYFRETEHEGDDDVRAHRRWKDDVAQAEEHYGQLFEEFMVLKEEEYLQLHRTKFTSADVPCIGDLVHLRSMPNYLHFSLGIVYAIEESDDQEDRTFWVRVIKPKSPQHPSPYD